MSWVEDTQSILRQLNGIEPDKLAKDPETRKLAINLSRKLTASLEPPVNRATDLIFAPYMTIAARIAVDLDLFSILSKSAGPLSSSKLAESSGGEELLINRLLRILAGSDFLRETSDDEWEANDTTRALAMSPIAAGHRMIYDVVMSSGVFAPKYFRETGHVSPTEPRDGILQYAKQAKRNLFEYLLSQPASLADFNDFMGNTMGARPYWYDWYPVEEQLLAEYDTSSALLVDIGGGKGHDLQAFHRKYPGRGRLVLQDLPMALDAIAADELDPTIEKVVQDFFKPQSIVGARAYFLHHILHDWSDKYALEILAQLKPAMKPGYSKLLIHDLALPDSKATAYQCTWDMNMLFANAAIERSRKQWSELLTKAGFHLVKIWIGDEDADGIVEAVVLE